MSLAEIYEAISGAVAVLQDMSIEATDPRLWTVIAALSESSRAIDELVEQE